MGDSRPTATPPPKGRADAAGSRAGPELDLPGWLQGAPQPPPPVPPPATPAPEREIDPTGVAAETAGNRPRGQQRPRSQPHQGDAVDRLPPLPDGGLAEGMPTWLVGPSPEPDRDAPSTVLPPPDPSLTDLRTFISDSDLPDWIRQLSAVEVAKPEEPPGDVAAVGTRMGHEEPAAAGAIHPRPQSPPARSSRWTLYAAVVVGAVLAALVVLILSGALG